MLDGATRNGNDVYPIYSIKLTIIFFLKAGTWLLFSSYPIFFVVVSVL